MSGPEGGWLDSKTKVKTWRFHETESLRIDVALICGLVGVDGELQNAPADNSNGWQTSLLFPRFGVVVKSRTRRRLAKKDTKAL
jgi:hypothetical protein